MKKICALFVLCSLAVVTIGCDKKPATTPSSTTSTPASTTTTPGHDPSAPTTTPTAPK